SLPLGPFGSYYGFRGTTEVPGCFHLRRCRPEQHTGPVPLDPDLRQKVPAAVPVENQAGFGRGVQGFGPLRHDEAPCFAIKGPNGDDARYRTSENLVLAGRKTLRPSHKIERYVRHQSLAQLSAHSE